MLRGSRSIVGLIMVAGLAGRLAAQEPPPPPPAPPEDPMAVLAAKESLTDEDRAALRRWLELQVTNINSNNLLFAQQSVVELRNRSTGTRDYREAFVTAALDVLGAAYKSAEPAAAARLLTVLGRLNDPRALPALLEGLKDNRAAVRAAAAIGIRNLRSRLPADTYGRVLAALVEAGRKETARDILQLIYRALNFAEISPAPDLKPAAAALLELLDDRAKRYSAETVPAEAAEAVGLDVGAALRGAMDEAERKRYLGIVARLLGAAVNRYVSGPAPLYRVRDKTSGPEMVTRRNGIELIIRSAEQQLREGLTPDPAPRIVEKMQNADATQMVLEMKRWAALVRDGLGIDLTVAEATGPEADKGPAPPP